VIFETSTFRSILGFSAQKIEIKKKYKKSCACAGLLYFTLITDDPLENSFLTLQEKQLLAENQDRTNSRKLAAAAANSNNTYSAIKTNLKYMD